MGWIGWLGRWEVRLLANLAICSYALLPIALLPIALLLIWVGFISVESAD